MELVTPDKVEGVICSKVIEEEAEELNDKGYEMIELCKLKEGIGMAAPQVGIYKNMIVKRDLFLPNFEIIFNPSFYRDGGITKTVEGCLNYPDEYFSVKRFKRIGVVYYIWNGEKFIKKTKKASGMEAFVFQHECNHLGVGCKNNQGTTIKMIGTLIKEDEIRKKKGKDGKEFKIPTL